MRELAKSSFSFNIAQISVGSSIPLMWVLICWEHELTIMANAFPTRALYFSVFLIAT